MRGQIAAVILFIGATLAPAWAGAMTLAGHAPGPRCQVANADKLSPASGGAATICAEIERAVKAAAPTVQYSVEVKVLSSSRLSAVAVVGGRMLAEQHFAVMDRGLDAASIRRFAEALATEVAKAAKE
jgi:hypothetical protein